HQRDHLGGAGAARVRGVPVRDEADLVVGGARERHLRRDAGAAVHHRGRGRDAAGGGGGDRRAGGGRGRAGGGAGGDGGDLRGGVAGPARVGGLRVRDGAAAAGAPPAPGGVHGGVPRLVAAHPAHD